MAKIYLTILFLSISFQNAYAIPTDQWCDKEWYTVVNTNASYDELLQKWLSLKNKCEGTGIYEFRLSSLYERKGNYKKAKELIYNNLSLKSKYHDYLLLGKYGFEFTDLINVKNNNKNEYITLINNYKKLIKNNPNWVAPYESTANIQLFIGQRENAIKTAKTILKKDNNSWLARRILVIAYTETAKYTNAKKFISEAIKLNSKLFGDSEFMYAAAWTYTVNKDYKTAEAVLNKLIKNNPAVKNDKKFYKVVNFLKQEMNKK